jgi:hypothetical protein
VARDDALIALLRQRDGLDTEVVLRDGRRVVVRNIAWGYDDSDDWAHVTTNVSPEVRGHSIDFFFTNDVAAVLDPPTGARIYDGA